MTVKDYQSDAALLGDGSGVVTEAEKAACRRVIAANAKGATVEEKIADARMLMEALGVRRNSEDIPVVPALPLMPGGNTTPPRILQ